ncbi:uncharacterized protein Z519_10346 [Cladophialophora bantiana CBS 173.52]|uniref:Uncharacterized protein n=1 Tax=Cladophialophora bantiana (strain ATCC 10958 / CBS 173.52 / CDC B-1940 / NIH 8579) TaxID=1442370 RepID=A0A0D2FQK1_CLAB1|nr:uncharacterized protein Z519_10346 [Cladophialophora bantiana CBS 173.52]KIW88862.1 hypothetical protein Z519_10346 [Cladophialophora bantiana CBS 173.52]
MSEAVKFIQHIKNTVAGAKDSKVIVTGGSYGGFLTTVLKMNHPDVFFGAIPFAAPLRSIGSNNQNPQRYEWFKWANQTYRDLSASAANKMKHALKYSTSDFKPSIAKDFNLCSVPETVIDLQTIMALINTAAYLIPQGSYNNPIANPTGASAQKLVNTTLHLTDPTQIINATLMTYYPPSSYPCIEWNSTQSDNPTPANEIPAGTVFVPTSIQTETDPYTRETLYDIVAPTQEYVETKYHITPDELVQAKRILFAYNEMDPTTAVGIDPLPITQDRNASRYMFTSLSAHGEGVIASYPGDKPSVVHARQVQLQTI